MSQLRMQGGGGTLLYDAVEQASTDIMKKLTGRKALIVLSDGVDYGSHGSLKESVEAAQRADTLVYSIVYSDSGAYGIFGGGSDGKRVLEDMSDETGGSLLRGKQEADHRPPVRHPAGGTADAIQHRVCVGQAGDGFGVPQDSVDRAAEGVAGAGAAVVLGAAVEVLQRGEWGFVPPAISSPVARRCGIAYPRLCSAGDLVAGGKSGAGSHTGGFVAPAILSPVARRCGIAYPRFCSAGDLVADGRAARDRIPAAL